MTDKHVNEIQKLINDNPDMENIIREAFNHGYNDREDNEFADSLLNIDDWNHITPEKLRSHGVDWEVNDNNLEDAVRFVLQLGDDEISRTARKVAEESDHRENFLNRISDHSKDISNEFSLEVIAELIKDMPDNF